MSNLIAELLLRFVKPAIAAALGAIVFWVATALLHEPASVSLALLAWLSATAFVLLVENNII